MAAGLQLQNRKTKEQKNRKSRKKYNRKQKKQRTRPNGRVRCSFLYIDLRPGKRKGLQSDHAMIMALFLVKAEISPILVYLWYPPSTGISRVGAWMILFCSAKAAPSSLSA